MATRDRRRGRRRCKSSRRACCLVKSSRDRGELSAPLLPKGTILKVTAWDDNTVAKKSNPDPNQWVGWGDRTVDEMAHAWINIVYMKDDDFKIEQGKRAATQTKETQPRYAQLLALNRIVG